MMNKKKTKIIHVVGARPNFMKIAPIYKELQKYKFIENILVHTGQHYDPNLSENFFKELSIPIPHFNLEVGSKSHAKQTAEIISRFEDILIKENPDYILLVGDVNSTIACALTAVKMNIKIIHVEAGLRSFDRTMPEEINRVLTDQISDLLFITSKEAEENLIREGVSKEKIFFVGNVMIDTLKNNLKKIKKSDILKRLKINKKEYGVLTLHRPSNVDNKEILKGIINTIKDIQNETKLIFPIHPRTKNRIEEFELNDTIKTMSNLIITNPLGYHDFGNLMLNAKFIMTDSGGIQEESTVLGIPCITIRENTERPITLKGTNKITGTNPEEIIKAYKEILTIKNKPFIPKYWDGKASKRIGKIIRSNIINSKSVNYLNNYSEGNK